MTSSTGATNLGGQSFRSAYHDVMNKPTGGYSEKFDLSSNASVPSVDKTNDAKLVASVRDVITLTLTPSRIGQIHLSSAILSHHATVPAEETGEGFELKWMKI